MIAMAMKELDGGIMASGIEQVEIKLQTARRPRLLTRSLSVVTQAHLISA
jgi:hypothetical protein